MNDKWNNASSYESYVGRWSRLVATEFLKWLNQSKNLDWLDVGCGTGALSESILKLYEPKKITGIDPSESHIEFAKEFFSKKFPNKQSSTTFFISGAEHIPLENNSIDVIVSGLVLNFIGDIKQALTEFKRVCRNNGMVCAYVWDYSGKMEMMRYFWDAAVSLSENARQKDEGVRFPVCNENALKQLFESNGFVNLETTFFDVPTIFNDFNDFWQPFLSGQAPAPGYCMSLSDDDRQKLKQKILESLPVQKDGSIRLIARAIAIKAQNVK